MVFLFNSFFLALCDKRGIPLMKLFHDTLFSQNLSLQQENRQQFVNLPFRTRHRFDWESNRQAFVS